MSINEKTLALILLIALTIFPIHAAHSANWYVGNGNGAALKQTLSSSRAGDTIIVGPGTYSILNGFVVSKPLHIISEKGPSETTIANYDGCIGVGGPCYGSFGFVTYGFSGSFTIKGFTIRGHQPNIEGFDGYGISVWDGSGIISNNILTHNATGIRVLRSSGVVIENNLIQTSDGNGIAISSDASADIRFNTLVHNYYQQIWLETPVASNTVVRNNIVALGDRWGLSVQGESGAVSLSCNDIWGNALGDCHGLSNGCIGVDGNISLDPLFCSGYYLHQESPCLGANTPSLCSGDHMGCYAVACEVATQKQSWGKVKAIFR